jgi:hypothetical protein
MRFARPVGCNDLILNLTTISLFKNSKVKILEVERGGRKTFFHLMYGKIYIYIYNSSIKLWLKVEQI